MVSKKISILATNVTLIKLIERSNKIHLGSRNSEAQYSLRDVLSIVIYGTCISIPTHVLKILVSKRIPVILYPGKPMSTIWITGGYLSDVRDVVAHQILKRNDLRSRKYIARQLLLGKFHDMEWLIGHPDAGYLSINDSIPALRHKEAMHAKLFWDKYFSELKCPKYTRRSPNEISVALDACSKFVSSIFLRWIHCHHLSPFHGFLHEPSDYPALVYDLFEPYRSIIDRTVFECFEKYGAAGLIERSIYRIKEKLKENIFCPQTRQFAARQELYHGIVLSLRSYLLGETGRFIIPHEGQMNGGRPQKHSWSLYGKKLD